MSQRWQEPGGTGEPVRLNGYGKPMLPIAEAMQVWQIEAAEDRERSIALAMDARRRACELRALLEQSNGASLGSRLAPFQAELDTWLGNLLVSRLDAEGGGR